MEVLHGVLDAKRTVDDAHAWRRVFPAASVTVLDECGHAPQLEPPGDVVAALERNVSRIRSTGR